MPFDVTTITSCTKDRSQILFLTYLLLLLLSVELPVANARMYCSHVAYCTILDV